LVAAGVRSILNFAPVVLQVPEEVEVRKVDLAVEMQILSFHVARRHGEAALNGAAVNGAAVNGAAGNGSVGGGRTHPTSVDGAPNGPVNGDMDSSVVRNGAVPEDDAAGRAVLPR
ncbi:MAG: redox-sensing transcriptional repressor, partial [Pseudonocardiales bacterium]|nr:redox-sensing transcriptional repressor [Pseudonocardiales bacterium]